MNLITNSIKFTKIGGIRIIARVGHTDFKQQNVISFDVIDTGIGISRVKLIYFYKQNGGGVI